MVIGVSDLESIIAAKLEPIKQLFERIINCDCGEEYEIAEEGLAMLSEEE